jgi:hypothetical protein
MKAKDVIELALSEVGYLGKKSNAKLYEKTANTSGKFTKYAQELYEAGYYNANKNGFNYCAIFVDWLFYHLAGSKEDAIEVKPYNIYNASCTWCKKAYQTAGRLSDKPEIGAQVFFKNAAGEVTHTGIIVDIHSDEGIATVEGNVANNVVTCTYDLMSSRLDSFGLPFYEEEPEEDGIKVTEEQIAALLQQVDNAYQLIDGTYNKLKDAEGQLTAALMQLDAVKEVLEHAND